MLEGGTVTDVDLLALEHGGDGDDDGELPGVTAEVVRHGEDGLVLLADQHDLGGLVKELGVRLGDVEAAEGEGGLGREEREEQQCDAEGHPLHGGLPS